MDADRHLDSYVRDFFSVKPSALQDRSDFTEAMSARVAEAQGVAMGARVKARLERSPVINTANHLCLECLPLTVQSMIVAGLGEDPEGVLPVDACASIPADNLSYPAGLQLARPGAAGCVRLPILNLSKKGRRQVTWLLDPFQREDLDRAGSKVALLFHEGAISSIENSALIHVIFDVLAAPDILDRPSFQEQVSVATPRLWDAWFTPGARLAMPALAYTPGESIRIPLLVKDLQREDTLANRMVFDPTLRQEVMARLDGIPGCWTDGGQRGGSALFWQIGMEKRTLPLRLEGERLYTQDGGFFPLEPEALVDGLERGTLLPTTFLNLSIGMARGLVQVGGFNQVDYLATIRNALAGALETAGYLDWAAKLSGTALPMLTAGLAAIALDSGQGGIHTAGGMDLLARGGLTAAELLEIRNLSLWEAMALELPGIAKILSAPGQGPPPPLPEIREIMESLRNRLLVIRL